MLQFLGILYPIYRFSYMVLFVVYKITKYYAKIKQKIFSEIEAAKILHFAPPFSELLLYIKLDEELTMINIMLTDSVSYSLFCFIPFFNLKI